jgi:hypothetical protein
MWSGRVWGFALIILARELRRACILVAWESRLEKKEARLGCRLFGVAVKYVFSVNSLYSLQL